MIEFILMPLFFDIKSISLYSLSLLKFNDELLDFNDSTKKIIFRVSSFSKFGEERGLKEIIFSKKRIIGACRRIN